MASSEQAVAVRTFARDGFLVVRGLCPDELCARLESASRMHLNPLLGPVEYEADLDYPGAPEDRQSHGGDTPRRLLNACSRDDAFREWATGRPIGDHLRAQFGTDACLSQCHHNCVMTKHPGHSSATLWHQDIRYWSFDRPELISVWLALGNESAANGALKIIPGTHVMDIDRGRLDSELFLRPELDENRTLIEQAHSVELDRGDALFFHCRLFHAAGMNLTDRVKLSAVFTYHAADNRPIPSTRSARLPAVPVR